MVFPVVAILCLGLISAAWLFFQTSALTNGARGGSRMASIETSLTSATSGNCGGDPTVYQDEGESGTPDTVAAAVQHATTQLQVNQHPLCMAAGSSTHLIQTKQSPTQANITVDLTYNTDSPPELIDVTVTVTQTISGFAPPLNQTYHVSAQSESPIINF